MEERINDYEDALNRKIEEGKDAKDQISQMQQKIDKL